MCPYDDVIMRNDINEACLWEARFELLFHYILPDWHKWLIQRIPYGVKGFYFNENMHGNKMLQSWIHRRIVHALLNCNYKLYIQAFYISCLIAKLDSICLYPLRLKIKLIKFYLKLHISGMLMDFLKLNPQVIAPPGEVHFFDDDSSYARGLTFYNNRMPTRRLRSVGVEAWHDDVIKWKHFPRYWPFVRGIHRSPVDSPHKGQWRGA